MQVPLVFHGPEVIGSEAFQAFVREQVNDLDRRFPGALHSCRVAVERPHRHDHTGSGWTVKVEAHVPPHGSLAAVADGGRVEHTDDAYLTAGQAFQAMRRQLERHCGSRRDRQRRPS